MIWSSTDRSMAMSRARNVRRTMPISTPGFPFSASISHFRLVPAFLASVAWSMPSSLRRARKNPPRSVLVLIRMGKSSPGQRVTERLHFEMSPFGYTDGSPSPPAWGGVPTIASLGRRDDPPAYLACMRCDLAHGGKREWPAGSDSEKYRFRVGLHFACRCGPCRHSILYLQPGHKIA